jgi:hypothetical protein
MEEEAELLTYDTKKFQVICGTWSSSGEADNTEEAAPEPCLTVGVDSTNERGLARPIRSVDQHRSMASSRTSSLITGYDEILDSLKYLCASPIDGFFTVNVLLAQCQVTQILLKHLL